MSKRLLHKTNRAYLLFSIVVLLVSAPVFYIVTQQLYIKEADDTLKLHKKEFLLYSASSLSESDIASLNKFNRNVNLRSGKLVKTDSLFFTSYYDSLDMEMEPYREFRFPVEIQGRQYTYTERINLVETEDILRSIVYLFTAIIVTLLIGLLIITKLSSTQLWRPFYKTLQEIENFEIDKNRQPVLPESSTEEFNRLNSSIQKLIERNISIYTQQREFIENAAHELQTPLAVFQAKIDVLIQRSDITQEQSEILVSLHDSVARLNRLNRNLLLLSKMENDTYHDKEQIDITGLINKNLAFFTEQAKAKNINIKILPENPIRVVANTSLVEILISNLFMNAIRHNIANGDISVIIHNNTLVFSNTGQQVSLNQGKLFNRFSKENPSGQGTGLGLSIIKKIAGLNNWEVAYNYADGVHSFSVSF